ncbi:Tryptophan--tRNA ligase, mitochondrial [Parahypoxylon ruwenzoriense]
MRATVCARCRPLAGLAPRQILRSTAAQPQPRLHQQKRNESTVVAPSSSGASTEGQEVAPAGSAREQEQEKEKKPKRRVIFSGIQPTGVPHLGNYLGALRQWKRLQDAAQSTGDKLLFSVVDLHAITMPQEAEQLRLRRREMLAALLAIGLHPDKGANLFFQSSVPAHAELMWILSCTASMGYLGRMTQWKSKLQMHNKPAGLDDAAMAQLKLGLFSYPVLQAADILVHRATHVPVGDDQRQHLEFARECATNFNHTFKNVLVPPETVTTPSPRVMSLTQPTSKMSKSTPNYRSRIVITATASEIRQRITSAVTDCHNAVSYDPEGRPGVANLLELLSQCSPPSPPPPPPPPPQEIEETAASVDTPAASEDEDALQQRALNQDESRPTPASLAALYSSRGATLSDLKNDVANAIIAELDGVRERYDEYLNHKGGKWLDEIEAEGAEVARRSAEQTMRRVRHAVGLGPRPS